VEYDYFDTLAVSYLTAASQSAGAAAEQTAEKVAEIC